MKELCSKLGIKQNLSTAYHPQTDGQVEHSHQETETFLRHYVSHLQDDWSDWLAMAEFQYNDKEHSTTKQTPFYLNYGRHPWKAEVTTGKEGNVTVTISTATCDGRNTESYGGNAKALQLTPQTFTRIKRRRSSLARSTKHQGSTAIKEIIIKTVRTVYRCKTCGSRSISFGVT